MAAKRIFDMVVAAAIFLLATPVLLIVGAGVWLSVGRPLLFRQTRVGLARREFRIAKFRTMRDMRDAGGALLPDEERVTRFGRLLRRTRLDELPELWQIARGDMSIVGPRPLPASLVGEDRVADRRHRMRPGLTGLAQVSGNTLLTQHEKVSIDLLYNDNRSLAGDLSIILQTVGVVLRGERRNEALIRKALAHAQHIDWSR